MKTSEFAQIINDFFDYCKGISENITNINPDPEKWSLKQIIGHLIDSASNNHQRFVRLQIDNLSHFPGYDQLKWVSIQCCNEMSWSDLIHLWYYLNLLLLHIIEHIDPATLQNTWTYQHETHSLESLIDDYYKHLRRHIRQFERTIERLRK